MPHSLVGPGDSLKKGYHLEKILGRGGMGTVFLAKCSKGKALALKALHLDLIQPDIKKHAIEQFRAEAELLKNLRHRGLVEVFDTFVEDGNHYLVMEYVDGITLAQAVKRKQGFFTSQQSTTIIKQLCSVIHFLHTLEPPIIFRDLKPSNIMLTRKMEVRLIDFGIARHFSDTTKTQTFIKGVGSAGYSPLEQYGAGTTDPRSDIYALGATIYTLLTKEKPPPVVSIVAGVDQLKSIRSINPDVPNYVEAVIGRMMAIRKEQRYNSIAEVAASLLNPPEDEEDPTGTLTLAKERAEKAELGPCLVCKRIGAMATPFQPADSPLVLQELDASLPATLILGLKEEKDLQSGLHFQKGDKRTHASTQIDLGFSGAAALILAAPTAEQIDGNQLLDRVRTELVSMALHLLNNLECQESDIKLAAVPVLNELAVKRPKKKLEIYSAIHKTCSANLEDNSTLLQENSYRLARLLFTKGRKEEAAALYNQCFSWFVTEAVKLEDRHRRKEARQRRGQGLESWLCSDLGLPELRSLLLSWSESHKQRGEDYEEPFRLALKEAERNGAAHRLAQTQLCLAEFLTEADRAKEAKEQAELALQQAERLHGPDHGALYDYVKCVAEIYGILRLPEKVEMNSRSLILKYRGKK